MSFVTRTIAAVLLAGCATPAFAVDINFSFQDGTTSYFYGRDHVAGTVTGTLYGLQDNATSLPTSFRIATSPDALALVEGAYFGDYYGSPGITLVNGVVTAANLFANFNDTASHPFQLRLNCTFANTCGSAGGLNHLINNGFGNSGTGNQLGFAGASYGAAASAVPEPASWAMMLAGVGAVGFAMRRRTKVRTAVRFA